MAKVKKKREAADAPAVETLPAGRWWVYPAALLAVLYAAFQVYAPVVSGPFVFDDNYLPFRVPDFPAQLKYWLTVIRPLLMISYWVNFRIWGLETTWYHVFNICFHAVNCVLTFAILRRLLELVNEPKPRREWLAGFGAAIFLLHPVQTESVAYVASRSENLSLMFFLGSLAVYVNRRHEVITWRTVVTTLALFGCAVLSKEHTVVLPVLFLLTDYFFTTPWQLTAIKRNWRLYAPIAVGGVAGVFLVIYVLSFASTAGFNIKEFTWYQYFFTQCRAFFLYLRLYILPVGLNADYAYPISHNVMERGAIVGLIGLVAIIVAAWKYRKRYPLACYGFFVFLALMAPTSSFVPLKDPVAERRLYLPFLGLLLITLDGVRRVRISRNALVAICAVILLLLAVGTYQRNQVWSSEMALWQDTVRKSPDNARAHFQLGYQYYVGGDFQRATQEYAEVARLKAPDVPLLMDWALAYNEMHMTDQAVAKLREAAKLENSAHVYATMAKVYADANRLDDAIKALDQAQAIDGNFAMTYAYRGAIFMRLGQAPAAVREYEQALKLDPNNVMAQQGIAIARQQRPR